MSLEHLCVHAPSIPSQLRAGGGKLGLASLAVLAPAPHTAVGADGGAPAVHAHAPDSVVLADGGAPAVLAFAPASVVLADGGAPAVLALAPHSVVLADGGAPAVLALVSLSVVLADGGAAAVLASTHLSVVLADAPLSIGAGRPAGDFACREAPVGVRDRRRQQGAARGSKFSSPTHANRSRASGPRGEL